MVRSWCDGVHSWYGVDPICHEAGVIPQSHSTWFLCTLYSSNSFGGFFTFCLSSMARAAINVLCVSVTRINRVFHSQHKFCWIVNNLKAVNHFFPQINILENICKKIRQIKHNPDQWLSLYGVDAIWPSDLTESKNLHKVTFTRQSDFRSY